MGVTNRDILLFIILHLAFCITFEQIFKNLSPISIRLNAYLAKLLTYLKCSREKQALRSMAPLEIHFAINFSLQFLPVA